MIRESGPFHMGIFQRLSPKKITLFSRAGVSQLENEVQVKRCWLNVWKD